jgi:hypothetical protein
LFGPRGALGRFIKQPPNVPDPLRNIADAATFANQHVARSRPLADVLHLTPPRQNLGLGTYQVDTVAIGNSRNPPAKNLTTTRFFAFQRIPTGSVSNVRAVQADKCVLSISLLFL